MHDYTVRLMGVTWTGKAASIGDAVRKAAFVIGIDSTWRGVQIKLTMCASAPIITT